MSDEIIDTSIDEIDDYITRINKILSNSSKSSIIKSSVAANVDKPAEEPVTRINNILTNSNKINIVNNSSGPKPGKSATVTATRISDILPNPNDINILALKPNRKTKSKKDNLLLNYKSLEQLESLCKRAVILHTQGVYVRPPENHNCNNKKRKRGGGKKVDRGENSQMPKKTFGQGRVGVSCEAYGIKKCTCCAPRNDEDILLMHRMNIPEFKLPMLSSKSPTYLDYVDLTDTREIKPSSSKKLDDSVILVSDSSRNNSLINPDEVIVLDDDSESETPITKINNVGIEIKTENKDLTNIKLEVQNLVATHKSEDTIITDIKSEMLDTVPNYADVENIADYIDLVTSDYDIDAIRKYEEELTEAIIQSEIEALSAASKNATINIPTENVTPPILNNTDIKTEVFENAQNYANIENITDYIDLVTSDYGTDAMMKELGHTEAIIQLEIEKLFAESKNTTKNVPTNNVTSAVLNKETKPKTDNVNKTVGVVASKAIASDSSRSGLTCPVCLESLIGNEVMSTICGHLFCADCIKEVIKKTKACPNCRRALNLKKIHPIYLG